MPTEILIFDDNGLENAESVFATGQSCRSGIVKIVSIGPLVTTMQVIEDILDDNELSEKLCEGLWGGLGDEKDILVDVYRELTHALARGRSPAGQ